MVKTPEAWQRVQELCDALESVPASEHVTLLERLEPDQGIRRDALALLDAMRQESGAQASVTAQSGTVAPSELPAAIGGYRIIERLGSGGSGEVFRAIRVVNGIEQPVALKRFVPQRPGTESVDRFEREQQILAGLNHPNIVHFIDAGLTENGQPFLVMELAEGQPITEYCDRKRLKLADRLRLMRAVCDAVHAAHRHLIVHLDLKPSNILVTEDGRIKLLDFGTARLVDPAAQLIRTQSLTLLYASPEQLRGDPVSVACDIYSLGLILSEMVSGSWPFKRPSTMMSVAERAVGQTDPLPLDHAVTKAAAELRSTTPARLTRMLHGDLDAICRRALAHDPGQRYASVAELAEDLRRYQTGAAVKASGGSVAYRLKKFVRRNVWDVAAVVTILTSLTAAAVNSARQAQAAQLAAHRAEAANQFMGSLFTLTGSDSASRANMTVRELLTIAQARIAPTLGNDPLVAADIENALSQGFVSQGAFKEALALAERARGRAESAGDRPRQAESRARAAYALYVLNRNDEAWVEANAALQIWREARASFTVNQALTTLTTGAATLSYLRPTDPVHRPYYEACVALARQALAVAPDARARCLVGLATSYTLIDSRYSEAEPLIEEALRLLRSDPTTTAALATTLQMRGLINRYLSRFDEDERAQRESLDIVLRLQGADAMTSVWQRAVWATSLIGADRLADADREANAALAAARRLVPAPGSYLLWTPLSSAMATACLYGRVAECESHAREAIATLGPSPADDDPRLASARGFLGMALAARRQCAEARPLIEAAMKMQEDRRRTPPYAAAQSAALTSCRH